MRSGYIPANDHHRIYTGSFTILVIHTGVSSSLSLRHVSPESFPHASVAPQESCHPQHSLVPNKDLPMILAITPVAQALPEVTV